jgi:hypothetical protein
MPRWSEVIELPDGARAIVCHSGPRPRPRRCRCGRPAHLLCDYPLLTGGTCDAPLCDACTVRRRGKDYCPIHPGPQMTEAR